MDFSETIEVKVFDKEGNYSIDSYFFAYFHNLSTAIERIRDVVRNVRNVPEGEHAPTVLDTTAARNSVIIERSNTTTEISPARSSFSSFRLSSILRPISDTISLARSTSNPEPSVKSEDFTHISRQTNSFIPITDSPKSEDISAVLPASTQRTAEDASNSQTQSFDHTYPPSTPPQSTCPDYPSLRSNSWGVGMPSWLKTRRMFSSGSQVQSLSASAGVKEVYSSTTVIPSNTTSKGGLDMAFSILETPDIPIDTDATEKFRAAFAYDEKETLLGCTSCLSSHVNLMAQGVLQISPVIFSGFCQYSADCISRLIISASSRVVR
jgi:sterol 3beta-glucosyltransferase